MKDSNFLSKQPAAAVGMLVAIFKYHLFLPVWVSASVQPDSSLFKGKKKKKSVLVVFWGDFFFPWEIDVHGTSSRLVE